MKGSFNRQSGHDSQVKNRCYKPYACPHKIPHTLGFMPTGFHSSSTNGYKVQAIKGEFPDDQLGNDMAPLSGILFRALSLEEARLVTPVTQ